MADPLVHINAQDPSRGDLCLHHRGVFLSTTTGSCITLAGSAYEPGGVRPRAKDATKRKVLHQLCASSSLLFSVGGALDDRAAFAAVIHVGQ